MLKTILVIVIFLSAMTIVSNLIPQQLTANINGAFVYFLGQINNLAPISLSVVQAIFNSIYILGNFVLLVASFLGIRWILNLIA